MNEQMGERVELSAAGAERRDALLPALQQRVVVEGRRRRRRRVVGRVAAGGVFVAAAAVVIGSLALRPGGSVTSRPPIASGPEEAPVEKGSPAASDAPGASVGGTTLVARIETDGGVVDRYRVRGSARVSEFAISDAELLDALASIGRPAGMVKSQGRVWLTAAVTDEAIGQQDRGVGG